MKCNSNGCVKYNMKPQYRIRYSNCKSKNSLIIAFRYKYTRYKTTLTHFFHTPNTDPRTRAPLKKYP